VGEFDEKIAALRVERATVLAAINDIRSGARIVRRDLDVTDQRMRRYQTALMEIDARIAAYEDIDASRT
jgi:hypothetical protein